MTNRVYAPQSKPITPKRQRMVVIKPSSGWAALNLTELWSYRDLLIILAGRDVKLRYKQTALGVIWVVLQPLIAALIFAAIFGLFARLPANGTPYLLFVYCGLVPWLYFAGALQRAGNSLVTDSRLISKVYFPRLVIPLASTFAVLIDVGVSLGVLALMMVVNAYSPGWQIITVPFWLFLTTVLAIGISLWLSALNVRYRDFSYALPFLIQVWMFASPIVYATSLIPDQWRWLYAINPVVGSLEGFRWAVLGTGDPLLPYMTLWSLGVAVVVFIGGAFFFRRVERGFADLI